MTHLMTISAFIKRYQEHATSTKTYREAYEKTEQDYHQLYGTTRYSSYESFRVVLHRFQSKFVNNVNGLSKSRM